MSRMKSLLLKCALFFLLPIISTALADDADLLKGKWETRKTNDQGQKFRQTIEVKKDKFVFEVFDSDDQRIIYAEDNLKLQKVGPFNSARFYDVRGGDSPSNLDPVND